MEINFDAFGKRDEIEKLKNPEQINNSFDLIYRQFRTLVSRIKSYVIDLSTDVTGQLSVLHLGASSTPSTSKFLREDGAFAAVTAPTIAESDVTNLVADLAARVLTSDARLSDARTPTAHATSHASAGSDPLTLAESQITNLTTDLAAKALASRLISAGTGLAGGGSLASDRTVSLTIPVAPSSLYTSVDVSTTGNIDDLSFSSANMIRMTNASLATIRGLAAGTAGQIVTIVSTGAGQVDFAHQNTGSTAANRLLNFATSGATSLAAGVGVASYQYDATTQRWRLIEHTQGAPIDVAYASGNFAASGGGTWTVDSGDQIVYRFTLRGRTLFQAVTLNTTSVAGVVNLVTVAIPVYTSAGTLAVLGILYDNSASTFDDALILTPAAGGTVLTIQRHDGVALTASVNNSYLRLVIAFEIQ